MQSYFVTLCSIRGQEKIQAGLAVSSQLTVSVASCCTFSLDYVLLQVGLTSVFLANIRVRLCQSNSWGVVG